MPTHTFNSAFDAFSSPPPRRSPATLASCIATRLSYRPRWTGTPYTSHRPTNRSGGEAPFHRRDFVHRREGERNEGGTKEERSLSGIVPAERCYRAFFESAGKTGVSAMLGNRRGLLAGPRRLPSRNRAEGNRRGIRDGGSASC